MVFEAVAGTVQELIDYALTIVGLMIIWYIIKFFLVAPPTEEDRKKSEDEWHARGEAAGNWISEKLKERETKQKEQEAAAHRQHQIAHRERGVRPAKAYLVKAIEEGENILHALERADSSNSQSRKDVDTRAKHHHHELIRDLKHVVKDIRHLRRKERHEKKVYEVFDNLYNRGARVALHIAKEIKLPKHSANQQRWRQEAQRTHSQIQELEALCGNMMNVLDIFIEHQKSEEFHAAASDELQHEIKEAQQQEKRVEEEAKRAQEAIEGNSAPQSSAQPAPEKKAGARPVASIKAK